MIELTVWRK